MEGMSLREVFVDQMIAEFWFGIGSRILEPPDTVHMGGTEHQIVVAVEVQVININVGGAKRFFFFAFGKLGFVEFPGTVIQFRRLFPPTVRNHDILTTIPIDVTNPEAMVVLKCTDRVFEAEWGENPAVSRFFRRRDFGTRSDLSVVNQR